MEIDLDQIFGFQAANYKLWSENLFISLIHKSLCSSTFQLSPSGHHLYWRCPKWQGFIQGFELTHIPKSPSGQHLHWRDLGFPTEPARSHHPLNGSATTPRRNWCWPTWTSDLGRFPAPKIAEIPLATSTNRISDGFDGERNVKQVVFWLVGHKVWVVLIMFRQSGISNDDGFLFATIWKISVKTMDFWVF